MNQGDIAERLIQAAEIAILSGGPVGPKRPRSLNLGYAHSQTDILGWGKVGVEEENRIIWTRIMQRPTPKQVSDAEEAMTWYSLVDDARERSALSSWAWHKAVPKLSFKEWCFGEGIHPITGRRRKDRALARISAQLSRSDVQHNEKPENTLLPDTPEIGDIDDNIAGRVQEKNGITSWTADDAFNSFLINPKSVRDRVDVDEAGFSWAAKRNQRRRQREAKKRKQEVA